MKLVLCSIVAVFDWQKFGVSSISSITEPNRSQRLAFNRVRLTNVRLATPGYIHHPLKGAMSHTAHVREEALHLENVRQLFQVLRMIQYQEFIVF